MSQYPITHACGHQVTYNITGKERFRRRLADWLAAKYCTGCRLIAETAQANESAAGRPPLSGSQYQTDWAVTIRERWGTRADIEMGNQVIKAERAQHPHDEIDDYRRRWLATIQDVLDNATTAQDWINHSQHSIQPLLYRIADRHGFTTGQEIAKLWVSRSR